MLPVRFVRPPPWSSAQPTSSLSGVGLLRWMVRFSLTASGAFMLTNQSHLNSETTTCPAFDVRIYGGETAFDGALLIQDASGNWRRLCFGFTVDILFLNGMEGATRVAEVVCRQIGIRQSKPSAVFYKYNSKALQENYTDFLYHFPLKCGGYENHLSECHPYDMEFKESATKDYQIREECYYGVACHDDNQLTLNVVQDEWISNIMTGLNSTGYVRASGVLNATAYGFVGRVCASFYDSVNRARIAQLSCRQMGYRTGFAIRSALPDRDDRSPFATVNGSQPSKTCLMPDTICNGEERSIAECDHKQIWGSFTPTLLYSTKWPGYPVPIGCIGITDGAFEIKTGLQLNNNSFTPNGVFIRYGTAWLPVVNSTDPYTCGAVCRSLYQHSSHMKAICHQEVLDTTVLRTTGRYAASIHCSHNELDVGRCAHHVELLNDDQSLKLNDHTSPQHLQVLCLDQQEQQLYNIELNVVGDESASHYGCIVAMFNGTERNVVAARDEERQIIAETACKNYHPERKLTTAFATMADLHYPGGERPAFSIDFECNEPSIVIGCSSDGSTAADCTYNVRNRDPEITWMFRSSLMAFCAYGKLELHLTANFTAHDGRLEFRFENGRAFVDVEGWDDAASAVACRQLGFGNALSNKTRKILAHSGMEWVMTNISCKGTEENLTLCSHQWRAISVTFGRYVAGVICKVSEHRVNTTLMNGDLNSGIVAIRSDATSIYICADSNPDLRPRDRVSLPETDILLCKHAGFTRVKNAQRLHSESAEQLPNSTLAYKNFVCKDAKSLLEECSHDGAVDLASCSSEDSIMHTVRQKVLILRCDEYEFGTMVRLVGGSTPFEGHVEVLYKGQWGAVCDDRLDTDASTVICRQLFGLESTGYPIHGSKFATKNERFLLDEVQCSSGAKTLAQCKHNKWGDHDCGPCEQAGVVCHEVPFIHQPTVAIKYTGAKPRLVCAAEGFPLPSYQWFVLGAFVSESGDSVDIRCHDSGTIVYICNAYNAAGERFIQVAVDEHLGCSREYTSEFSTLYDKRVMTSLAVGLCLSTLGIFGVLLYALSLRRAITKATQSEKDMTSSVAYSTMNLTTNESS